MKCEICHDAAAVTAITRVVNDEEEELYVCRACADSERKKRQKKSQLTHKPSDDGFSDSACDGAVGNDEAVHLFDAVIDAVHDFAEKLERSEERKPQPQLEYTDFRLQRVEAPYRINARLHLEGLYLIGEIPAVKRAFHALQMELRGIDCDGFVDIAHVYDVRYVGVRDHAAKVVRQLIEQERNARLRLLNDERRVFGDSVCRALAILKNCRLVSDAEVFDLISPLRIAAYAGVLEGIETRAIERLVDAYSDWGQEKYLSSGDRDRHDAWCADQMNKRFENVILNERGEALFL